MLLYCFVSQVRNLSLTEICSPYKGSLIVETVEFHGYKSNSSEFFEISVSTCLLRRLPTTMASVLFQPAPAHAPPPIAFTGKGTGAVMLLYLFKAGPKCDCHACGHSV